MASRFLLMVSSVAKNRRPLGFVRVVQQPLQKTVLHLPAPLYHGAGLFRPDEQGLAAVTCHGLPPEVALLHEAVHIDRDKVRF